jgi:hypothetical protein
MARLKKNISRISGNNSSPTAISLHILYYTNCTENIAEQNILGSIEHFFFPRRLPPNCGEQVLLTPYDPESYAGGNVSSW